MPNLTACTNCDCVFEVTLPACPGCGSGDRFISLKERITYRDDLRIKGITPNPAGGKPLIEFLQKTKIGGESKRETLEKFTKDRSSGKTKVLHEVWEEDESCRRFVKHRHYKNN